MNRRFELGVDNFCDGGSHSAAIITEGYAPAPPAQFLARISHDNRMAGELKHFHIIMVVTDGHDLIAPEAAMGRPTFERVSFGTARIQDVDHRQISLRIFGAEDGDAVVDAAVFEGPQSLVHSCHRATKHGLHGVAYQ